MAFCCSGSNKVAPWTRAERVPRRVPRLHRQQQRTLDRLKSYTSTRGYTATGLSNTREEFRVVFQAVLEPIVLGVEANEYPGRLAVPCDHDLLGRSQTEVVREIIFDLGERNLTAVFGRARQARLRLLLS